VAARRLREPVVQMRETLVVAKTEPVLATRVERIEGIMLARGMKRADAGKRLARALLIADGELVWAFGVAWEIGWDTIYWPHRTDERNFEKARLRFARPAFAAAWHGEPPTPMERLASALEALEHARDETAAAAAGFELVA
jgi:hypothetical protein